MSDKPKTQAPILNSVGAPDFYADHAAAFAITLGNVRVTMVAVRPDYDAGDRKHVAIGHLVMPIESARNMAKGLLEFLERADNAPVMFPGPQTIQ